MKNFLIISLSCAAIFFAHHVYAQQNAADNDGSGAQSEAAAPVPPKGPIEFYGQTLNPYLDYYYKEGEKGFEYIKEHNAYTWDDLRYLVPELFPEYHQKELEADYLCDMMVKLDQGYISQMEMISYKFIGKLGSHFPDYEDDLQLLDELDARLRSKDDEAMKELIGYVPDDPEKIMAAKEFKLKSWAVSILRDAAIKNCPDHAKSKLYVAHVGPYPTEDAEGNIVWMDGTIVIPKNN